MHEAARPPRRRGLVVHESILGSTSRIAAVVEQTLRHRGYDVVADEVNRVSPMSVLDADLVVLGAPTHAFSLSRPATRSQAARRGSAYAPVGIGLREWIAVLPESGRAVRPEFPVFAVFDTRVTRFGRLPAAAAPRAVRFLHHQGYAVLAPPRGFFIEDVTGPLRDGEEARAATWADGLAEMLTRGPRRVPRPVDSRRHQPRD